MERRRSNRGVAYFALLLLIVASANVAAFALQRSAYTIVTVQGSSMSPTVKAGDRVAVDRRVDFQDVQRGELVVVRVWRSDSDAADNLEAPPAGDPDSELVVKRVIGLPGERIEMRDRVVAVDDTIRLQEPYAQWGDSSPSFEPLDLADDEVYAMGDNRPSSRDSRAFGPIVEDAYVGSVKNRIWPLARFGGIEAGATGEADGEFEE